jgi:hypothetical protein
MLSVPFVYLFGLSGMLVVPALSLLCFLIFVQMIANKCEIPRVGIILSLLFSTSITLLRWTTVNYSDGLLLALFSMFVYLLYISGETWTLRNLTLLSLIICLATYTRQTLPIWLLLGTYFLVTKKRRAGFVIILVSLASSIPSILTFPYQQFFDLKQDGNFLQSILGFFGNAIYVNSIEIAQLIILDRTLLIILVISYCCGLKFRGEIFTHLFLLTTLGAVLINSLVGIPGVNFRYLLPTLPFAALVMLKSKLAESIEQLLTKSQSKNQVRKPD